jgi:hypothetical protein
MKLDALALLRSEISPHPNQESRVSTLASLLFRIDSPSTDHTKINESRQSLLSDLTPLFPASLIVPENRLDTLLSQAVKYQVYLLLFNIKSRSHNAYITTQILQVNLS